MRPNLLCCWSRLIRDRSGKSYQISRLQTARKSRFINKTRYLGRFWEVWNLILWYDFPERSLGWRVRKFFGECRQTFRERERECSHFLEICSSFWILSLSLHLLKVKWRLFALILTKIWEPERLIINFLNCLVENSPRSMDATQERMLDADWDYLILSKKLENFCHIFNLFKKCLVFWKKLKSWKSLKKIEKISIHQ